jgi:hypothetical protein
MADFDYTVPAELFASSHRSKRSALTYHRFATSAEAIKFAVESLSPESLSWTVMEVSEVRFDAAAIRELYQNADFPLGRTTAPATDTAV